MPERYLILALLLMKIMFLEILGYNLIRSDHPSNNKCGVACIYYQNFLPLQVLRVQYLQEYISFELNIFVKNCNFISLNKSPS